MKEVEVVSCVQTLIIVLLCTPNCHSMSKPSYSTVPEVFAHGPCGPTVFNQPQSPTEIYMKSDWLMSTDPVRILLAPYCRSPLYLTA
jgi:hypothetical protein